MLKFSKKGSKLIVIFILTVIVSGSILTYLSINHISNYRELLENKISEEERELTKRFSSDFQVRMESLTLKFSDLLQNDSFANVWVSQKFDSIVGLLNYVAIDTLGSFITPNFFNKNIPFTEIKPSKIYLERLHAAEKNEFNALDFNQANNFYLSTLKVAETKSDSAQVYNSLGRLYVKMNFQQKAIETYQIMLLKFSNTLNSSGFPYAYFSIIKLLKISNPSNFELLEELLLSFLNELDVGTIPLNDSTEELLNSIEEWQHKYQNRLNNELFKNLIERNKNSLLLINNYTISIENQYKEKNDEFRIDLPIDFLSFKPISGSTEEMMLFFRHKPISVGFVIGLNPLFIDILENQESDNLKFEYKLKLVKKTGDNFLTNTNLITFSEFSPYFEDSLIQVSLKNKNLIDEAVLRRKVTYGIGLFLFLGTMVLGLYLLIQDVNREKIMNKLRADFVSNVTHELKTPLTSIHMFAEALNMGQDKLDTKQRKYTNIIVKESEKLKRMINNILEFSRKENNKLSYNLEKSNLTKIVNSTLDEMDYFLEINKVDVNLAIANNIFANVYGEGLKLALSNLISNAVKYSTSNKKLNVRLFQLASEIFIEVEDFGSGIPKDKLELIFEKFYRVNENETVSGTGLGLTVAKAIIEEQHGKLLVKSALGKGSKFTIVFNAA